MVESGPSPNLARVLVLCRDLMFASKIRSAAGAGSVAIRLLRDPIQLIGLDADALIVDLGEDGAVAAGASWKAVHPSSVLIGFVAHTDTATIDRAKATGFDQVLTRGQFAASVVPLLANIAGRPKLPNPN